MKRYLFPAYVLSGILTFGSAYNHRPLHGVDPSVDSVANTAGALMQGACWPLYWSYRLFEPEEAK